VKFVVTREGEKCPETRAEGEENLRSSVDPNLKQIFKNKLRLLD